MKRTKKALALLLSAILAVASFSVGFPYLKIEAAGALQYDANGDIIIDGVTQTQIVDVATRDRIYAGYAADYLNGAGEPTDIVIPGLDPTQDYVIQGMSYYPAKDWMLVTAYHNDETASSKVFALDAATGEFVAMFDFLNPDGTTNMDHGGGIAVSENNLYYACGDKDRMIAYAPLSEFDVEEGTYKTVQLVAKHEFYEVGSVTSDDKTAYTAYVCYDQGVLWTGNFYDPGTSVVGVAVAQDYNCAANSAYNSMVFGYRLSGDTPAEEWANLTGSTGADCQGSPSYTIALNNNIKDVQYAVVDNGKLYLSRSYGSGAGNSVSFGFGETSTLTIADIDLTTPGKSSVNILVDGAGTTKDVNAYVIDNYSDYPMMPMSEGLCVIDDYVFITFESASNKYLNESDDSILGIETSIGNCEKPVDIVWKVDQYELMGQERPSEEVTLYYEQVMSKSELTDGEEYLIVYKSAEEDPITQKPILYAFDSNGGLQGNRLSKRSADDTDAYAGYNAMIGHAISDYDIEDGKLYLYNAAEDDTPNLRWKIYGANSGALRIKGEDTYYSEYRNFHFNSNVIGMAADGVSDLSSISIDETGEGDGGFYLNNGGYYLWCNDGVTEDYTSKANTWYANNSGTAMYSGVTEQSGTFHCDALNGTGSNMLGGSVTNFDHGTFYVYKRAIDPYVSTAESRVYTDMSAELQSDGTYTVTLETYATGEVQYQTLDAERPTDFIFVLDASASMTNNTDCSGYQRYTSNLTAYAVAGDDNTIGDTDASTMSGGFMYVKINGDFCPLTVEGSARGNDGSWISPDYYKYYWLSADCNGTTYYWVPTSTSDATQGGSWSTTKPAESATMKIYGNSDANRASGIIYYGEHFRYWSGTGATRLCCMQTAFDKVTHKIADAAASTGLNHRIAVVQFGSDGADDVAWLNTGMYTNDSTTMQQYSGSGTIAATTYSKAFYDVDSFETLRNIVWAIDTTNGDSDTFSNYGFDMANEIINNSGNNYRATGERSVALIMLTDGVPGKGGEDSDSANNTANAAVTEVYEAKNNGASVYSVQMGNNSMDNFSMNLYMEAVSSEYVTAKSLSDLGDPNPNDVDYHMDITTGTTDMFDVIADSIFNSVQANSKSGFTKLDEYSVLREELSEAFIVPTDGSVGLAFALVPISYDKIGRIQVGTAVDTSFGYDYDGNRTLTVTGYDYSDQYISKTHPGNKLRVTISGLLANPDPDANITNTSINNTDTTAIYQDSYWMNTLDKAFKYFPSEYFTIPEYTYVLDFGLQMLDTDVNGDLCAVSATPSKQDVDNYNKVSENGLVAIEDGDQNLIYSANPTEPGESGYVLIQRSTGRYDWFEIKVVPASNVLYEESTFTMNESTNVDWVNEGSAKAVYQDLTADEDVYGNDSAYAVGENAYSNGTALTATVNSTDKRSDTAVFNFTGTGFDLISACGANTGTQIITVKKSDGSIAKVYIVDTYYNDTTYVGSNGVLNQVPIASFTGDHDTYSVEVTAAYLSYAGALTGKSASRVVNGASVGVSSAAPTDDASIAAMLKSVGMGDLADEDIEVTWFDDNSIFNGGTGAKGIKSTRTTRVGTGVGVTELVNYIDGMRIYHPMGSEYSDYIEGEQGAEYVNVIDNLVNESLTDSGTAFGLAYVEGSLADGESLTFTNYQSIGPENEFYLAAGTADTATGLAFNIDVPSGSKIMLGLRAINGATTVKVNGSEFLVNSATEMYYDITTALNGATTVTVVNTGSSPLAVNNIKLSGNAAVSAMSLDDMGTIDELMSMEAVQADVVNGVVTVPVAEEEPVEPEIPEDSTGDTEEGTSWFNILDIIMAILGEFLKSIMSFLG